MEDFNIIIDDNYNEKNIYNKNKEESFDRLCKIQKLIKKYSILKALCKIYINY
jgi:hypothetical protein